MLNGALAGKLFVHFIPSHSSEPQAFRPTSYTGAKRDFLRLLSFERIAFLAHVKWGSCRKAVHSLHPVAFVGTASVPPYKSLRNYDANINRGCSPSRAAKVSSMSMLKSFHVPLSRAETRG